MTKKWIYGAIDKFIQELSTVNIQPERFIRFSEKLLSIILQNQQKEQIDAIQSYLKQIYHEKETFYPYLYQEKTQCAKDLNSFLLNNSSLRDEISKLERKIQEKKNPFQLQYIKLKKYNDKLNFQVQTLSTSIPQIQNSIHDMQLQIEKLKKVIKVHRWRKNQVLSQSCQKIMNVFQQGNDSLQISQKSDIEDSVKIHENAISISMKKTALLKTGMRTILHKLDPKYPLIPTNKDVKTNSTISNSSFKLYDNTNTQSIYSNQESMNDNLLNDIVSNRIEDDLIDDFNYLTKKCLQNTVKAIRKNEMKMLSISLRDNLTSQLKEISQVQVLEQKREFDQKFKKIKKKENFLKMSLQKAQEACEVIKMNNTINPNISNEIDFSQTQQEWDSQQMSMSHYFSKIQQMRKNIISS